LSTDELADQIVARCRERLERGEDVDPEAVIRAHPDMADALRAQFAAFRLLERAFAKGGASRVTDAPSLAGRALGAYRLASAIGAGGMGTVYVATVETRSHGLDAGTRVAVKVIHPHLIAREGSFQRFLREAEIGGRVRHENVVRTLAADEVADASGTSRFLVMEYVEGRTLRELGAELTRVPEELCRHVGREIAKALTAIHAAGAVHRDVKPDNVIVTPDNVVKVMDLGVARLEGDALRISQTGAFVGSVRYAAPEQFGTPAPRSATSEASSAKGVDAVDGRADLYALGLTLYELSTGKHPFDDDDFVVVMRRQMDDVPRPAGEVNPQLSPFFEEVLRRLLEKDRDARFASATALLDVLEQGESSAWWQERAKAIRADTRRPLRRIRIPRETALYGRDAELARLRALYEKTKAGDGQVVLVEGEAGIGKSRLVDEFVGALAASGEDVNFLYGSHPPGGAATASGAFTSAYREHLGDDEASVRAALPQTPLLVPAFAALLRGDVAPDDAEKLTKDSLQTVFVHATRSFAATRPTIVLIDDLHFAPDEGRALFASLALAVPGHRILLVGTARPEIDEKWIARIERIGHASRVSVPRLTAKDLVLLLRDSLKSQHLAEELAGKIAVKSDGNPFFVFEILRGLRDGQFLTRKPDGTWATTRLIAEIDVPPTVKDLIFARVGSLSTAERNLLDVAACAGFDFDPVLAGEVLGLDRINALQRLAAVEKSHRLVRSSGRRFVFDHHQIAEVLYAGLPEMLREEYHAAIGAALETRSGASTKEPKDLDGALCVDLAEHYLRGARGERAVRYLDAALQHLEKGYLHDAALRLADRALAVPGLVAGRQRCDVLLRKARRLDFLGRRDAQRAALEEANALADADGDAALRSRARSSLGWLYCQLSLHDEAQTVGGEALAMARAAGDRKQEAQATGYLGFAYHFRGRFSEAKEQFERHLALCREIGNRQGEATATGNLGLVFQRIGRLGEAREHYERSLALCRELGNRWGETAMTGNLGLIFQELSRLAEAQDYFERHLALSREIGNRAGEANATGNLGSVLRSRGRFGEAREHLERAIALAREIGYREVEAIATGNMATTSMSLGRLAEAREHLGRSLSLARAIENRGLEGCALNCLGAICAEERHAADAERGYAEALGLFRDVGNRDGEADVLVARGALNAQQGREAEARSDLDAALTIALELSLPNVELRARAHLATLPGGDFAPALAAFAAHEGHAAIEDAMEARFLLWQATRDPAHLADAKRRLDFFVEHAPPDCRGSMLANVRIHHEIAAAAREAGLLFAADSNQPGDGRSAASAEA
jgi:serine/threonine protein kinase/tetratricopeptide (TPR) repeat protein